MPGEWPAAVANGRQRHRTASSNLSKCLRSPPFASRPPPLGSGAERRGGSSPLSCTEAIRLGNPGAVTDADPAEGTDGDDSGDDPARGRLVTALTDALRRMLLEGGEGGDQGAGRACWVGHGTTPQATNIDEARRRHEG